MLNQKTHIKNSYSYLKPITLLLLICMIFLSLSTPIRAETDFAGGSGSNEDPYLIENAEQLDKIRKYPEKCFRQTNDIDLSDYKDGSGWQPIADFKGIYDGGGYRINNLIINHEEEDYIGLFTVLDDESIIKM